MAAGKIDVIDIYSTDAKIDALRLRVLADDRGYFPRYDAVLLYRARRCRARIRGAGRRCKRAGRAASPRPR